MAIIEKHRDYRFGSASGLPPEQMDRFIRLFERAPDRTSADLGGRNQPHITNVPGWGPVVVKHYFRGGIIRHCNRRTYLKLTGTRGQAEFDLLTTIRKFGVNAPEPVAFAEKGLLFYTAWLVTRQIPESASLADLSRSAPIRAEEAMPSVIEQVLRLIEGGVLHLDLHPGNVLIDRDGKAFVIDLDKAKSGRKNPAALRRRYLRRWERAVTKYGLPAFLRDRMRDGLSAETAD